MGVLALHHLFLALLLLMLVEAVGQFTGLERVVLVALAVEVLVLVALQELMALQTQAVEAVVEVAVQMVALAVAVS
jgi:hypothetical protein